MKLKIGDRVTIDGVLMRYIGDGKFERAAHPPEEMLVKWFDVGGPIGGLRPGQCTGVGDCGGCGGDCMGASNAP